MRILEINLCCDFNKYGIVIYMQITKKKMWIRKTSLKTIKCKRNKLIKFRKMHTYKGRQSVDTIWYNGGTLFNDLRYGNY